MPYWTGELINLALRWFHVLAAIFWIGQTALFTWLDIRMRVEGPAAEGAPSEVWMVHGGGFYRTEKLPWQMPPRLLHWFKWEAAFTWISGLLLFSWVYYAGGILVPPDGALSGTAGVAVSLGALAAAWVVYDLLWIGPLERRPVAGGVLCFVLLLALAWGLGRVFTARAVYLQVGATLGTVMAANVWVRILPAMRRAVALARAGETVGDDVLAQTARAARRSKHNTYLVFPVVFLMISNHYPVTTYGHRFAWALLGLYAVIGFAARWLVDRRAAREGG